MLDLFPVSEKAKKLVSSQKNIIGLGVVQGSYEFCDFLDVEFGMSIVSLSMSLLIRALERLNV